MAFLENTNFMKIPKIFYFSIIKRWSEAESFTYKSKSWLHPLIDWFILREFLVFLAYFLVTLLQGHFAWISGVFSILFGYIPYYRVICRVNFWCFSILFGCLTTGSYVAWNFWCFLHTFWLPNYRVIFCVNIWCFFAYFLVT